MLVAKMVAIAAVLQLHLKVNNKSLQLQLCAAIATEGKNKWLQLQLNQRRNFVVQVLQISIILRQLFPESSDNFLFPWVRSIKIYLSPE